VNKELKTFATARKKSRKQSSYHEPAKTLTRGDIFRLIEQQFLKITLVLANEEKVEEIQQRLWEGGIEDYNKRPYKNSELFTEKFRPLIKKTFVPHMYRKQVWPLLIEDVLFIRKEYFNELVERLHLVPERVKISIARDLDRTVTQESNVVNPQQFKDDMALLLMLYHLHRPDISYVQGMTYPLAVLLAVLDKF